MLRDRGGIQWRRNFRLSTVGDANAEVVDSYVADQLAQHTMATEASQSNLANAAWHDPSVDVTEPILSSHGQYILGLHGVLVHAERWRNACPSFLEKTRQSTLFAVRESGCHVARIALLADHMHFLFRFHYDNSLADVMMSLMNRVCEAHDGLRIWMDGFYVGSVGPYDMNAVRK